MFRNGVIFVLVSGNQDIFAHHIKKYSFHMRMLHLLPKIHWYLHSYSMFVQSGHLWVWVCLGSRMCFASEQWFPAPETGSTTLATWGKHRKYKLRSLNSTVFLHQWWNESQNQRENNEQHTVLPKRQMFKLEGWRGGHTQKVNFEAVERKDNYGRCGRIHTYVPK